MSIQPPRISSPGDGAESESAASVDPIDELLANYNFICHPEARLKFKQQISGFSLGVCLAKPWTTGTRIRITLKPPVDATGFLNKSCQKLLVVPTHSQVALFSRKLNFWWLRLQFVVGYNWNKRRPTLDYRVTTKWGDGPRLKRKERFDLGENVQLRCKWNLDFHLPDMEGHLGVDNLGMDAVDVDWGRLDFEIAQLDLSVHSPYKLWAKQEPKPSSTNGNGGAGKEAAKGTGSSGGKDAAKGSQAQEVAKKGVKPGK